MEVISGRISSGLNPYAAPYVPGAYRAVEDFSEEWWALVDSSPYFRDYWLRECFEDPENDPDLIDIYDPALSDTDSLFHSYPDHQEVVDKIGKELVGFGSEKWRMTRGGATDRVRWFEKAPKIVSVKVSPRTIQQPR